MKTYDWKDIRDIPSVKGKLGRTVAQFTPHTWTAFDWAASKSLKGYFVALTVVTLFLIDELSAFYLKALLWIPTDHWINGARIALHALSGAVAIREIYQYFTDAYTNMIMIFVGIAKRLEHKPGSCLLSLFLKP